MKNNKFLIKDVQHPSKEDTFFTVIGTYQAGTPAEKDSKGLPTEAESYDEIEILHVIDDQDYNVTDETKDIITEEYLMISYLYEIKESKWNFECEKIEECTSLYSDVIRLSLFKEYLNGKEYYEDEKLNSVYFSYKGKIVKAKMFDITPQWIPNFVVFDFSGDHLVEGFKIKKDLLLEIKSLNQSKSIKNV